MLKLNQKTGLCLINRLPVESYRKSYGTFNSHSLSYFRVTSLYSQASRNQKISKNNAKDSFALKRCGVGFGVLFCCSGFFLLMV